MAALIAKPTQLQTTEPVGQPIPTGKTIDAWNLAVENNHDAVVGTGFPTVMYSDALAQLEDAGIPVVIGYVTEEPATGVIAVIAGGPDIFGLQGKVEAQFVVGRVGEEADTLFLGGSTFPGIDAVQAGYEAEYKRLCPDCEFDALEGAGSEAKIVTNFPDTSTAQMLADGQIDGMIMFQQGDSMWQMVDALARHFAGVPVEPSMLPSPAWAITQDNVDQLTGDPYVLIEDYQAQYRALWGK